MQTVHRYLNKRTIAFCLVFLLLVGVLVGCGKRTTADPEQQARIKQKAEQLQQGVTQAIEEEKEFSHILALAQQVEPLVKQGKFDEAEAILDEALKELENLPDREDPPEESSPTNRTPSAKGTFSNPERIDIVGYDDEAMEPFVSGDGDYLFWNNKNDARIDTNLHYATRIDETSYQYQGELGGVNSKGLDAVPSMDDSNNFYFVTTRSYAKNQLTIYGGTFDDGAVSDVDVVTGTFARQEAPYVNMDVGVSFDGNTFYYVEALFETKDSGIPDASDIFVAHKVGNQFMKDENSDTIMKNINTDKKEYAPAISSDELELFFTRAEQIIVAGETSGFDIEVMAAERSSVDEPFGEPYTISAISGFVEAPTITEDGKELFYHKLDGGKLRIFRVTR